MSWFQGLSSGKTCSAARIRSASGVSHMTGLVIGGIGGRPAAKATAAAETPAVARVTRRFMVYLRSRRRRRRPSLSFHGA
jgi:hypothetical protein